MAGREMPRFNTEKATSDRPMRLFYFIIIILTGSKSVNASEVITYAEQIEPIFRAKCTGCHHPGKAAPFSLVDYTAVKKRTRTIQRVVADRYMPPWHAIGGDIPLLDDRRLSETEQQLIDQWIEEGAPMGAPEKLPEPPVYPDGWRLGEPDLIVKMEKAYKLPAEGPDIYRNFVIRTGLKKKRYIKAIEFRASSPQVVHHALIYADASGRARRIDNLDKEPGFEEMPIGEGAGRLIGGWVPGTQPRPLPAGLAHELPAKSEIVIQIHFHLSGKPEAERSTIGFYFTDKPPRKKFTSLQLPPVFGAFSGIDLEPGAAETKISDSFKLPVDVKAFGVQPHAHYRGKSIRLTAQPPGSVDTVTLLNIPDWDLNWQEEYRFKDMVSLPAGTTITSEITWDNSADDTDNPVVPPVRVRWGFESFDEMGSVDLLVIPQGKNQSAAMNKLRQSYREHLTWTAGKHVLSPAKLSVFGKLRENALTRFDHDRDGTLGHIERAEATAALRKER